MLETVQSQAVDSIDMDSVLNPEIIYITEYYALYTLPDMKSLCEKISLNNIHKW